MVSEPVQNIAYEVAAVGCTFGRIHSLGRMIFHISRQVVGFHGGPRGTQRLNARGNRTTGRGRVSGRGACGRFNRRRFGNRRGKSVGRGPADTDVKLLPHLARAELTLKMNSPVWSAEYDVALFRLDQHYRPAVFVRSLDDPKL